MLLVVAVLAVGALGFGAALLLRGGGADVADSADDGLSVTADASESATQEQPPASFTAPRGAVAEPCPAAEDVPAPAVTTPYPAPPLADLGGGDLVVAVLRTTCGDVELALDADAAPGTVANFLGLAADGYYDGVPFHRVINGFMVQGGDPTGTGTGCLDAGCEQRLPGYTIPDELGLAEELVAEEGGYPRGTLAMANSAQPDTAGSQFFIVQADPGYALPPAYAVFGRVSAGMDVVDRIAQGPAQGDRAIAPVAILGIDVEG
jgi:cyclophilin family peptidyl-prolyl cis-trans isomerase